MQKFKEYWKTVVINGVEHPRYQVSNLGRVKCKWIRGEKWKICRLTLMKNGYFQVNIDNNRRLVHRLVAEAFIPNPQNKPCIDHIYTIRTQNVVLFDDNSEILYTTLRWVSYEENINNPISIKRLKKNCINPNKGKFGSKHHNSIPIVQLTLDGQFIKKWACARDVERELGIVNTSITKCCKGKQKSAGGFRWMYYSDWVKLQHKKPSDIKPLF